MNTQVSISTILYSYIFSIGAIGGFLWVIAKKAINHVIEEHLNEMKESLYEFNRKFDRIEYALYNDGKTGLVNKVDALVENQQTILIDVEVMKAKYESI